MEKGDNIIPLRYTLTIHAVDREKLDRELEKVLGADDDEFARETAARIHGRPIAFRNPQVCPPEYVLHENTFDSRYARFKSGTEAAWRREKLDWSIQPPTTRAERKRLIWGSGLVLGGLVVLVIAAIAAGFKLAMG